MADILEDYVREVIGVAVSNSRPFDNTTMYQRGWAALHAAEAVARLRRANLMEGVHVREICDEIVRSLGQSAAAFEGTRV